MLSESMPSLSLAGVGVEVVEEEALMLKKEQTRGEQSPVVSKISPSSGRKSVSVSSSSLAVEQKVVAVAPTPIARRTRSGRRTSSAGAAQEVEKSSVTRKSSRFGWNPEKAKEPKKVKDKEKELLPPARRSTRLRKVAAKGESSPGSKIPKPKGGGRWR